MNDSDHELLRRFAQDQSAEAFNQLMDRHVNWVYSVCRRLVRDAHLAEDVTQAVFIVLVNKAGKISPRVSLTGWLYKVAGYCSSRALRDQATQKRHEKVAAMNTNTHQTAQNDLIPDWEEFGPQLEQQVARLGSTDRLAVLLRFYQNKSMKEIGVELGASEDAATKRLSRALVKLRRNLSQHGVVLPSAALEQMLGLKAVQATSSEFMAKISGLAKSLPTTGKAPLIAMETLNMIRKMRIKLVVASVAGVVGICLLASFAVLEINGNANQAAAQTVAMQPAVPISPPAEAGPNFSTPQDTIRALLAAEKAADTKAMLDCILVNTPAQEQLLTTRCEWLAAKVLMNEAAEAKFGPEAEITNFNGREIDKVGQAIFADLKLTINGDTATAVSDGFAMISLAETNDSGQPITPAQLPPAIKTFLATNTFKRVGTDWKYYAAKKFAPDNPVLALLIQKEIGIEGMQLAGINATTAAINAGQFSTLADAKNFYQQQMQAIMKNAAAAQNSGPEPVMPRQ
jgi:RNA polymerase sigma factor (sigma-70 family)